MYPARLSVGGTKCLFVGDTVLQREETCCYSDIVTSVIRALRNKNKKTHHNSCSAQRKPEGGGRKKTPKPSRNLSSLSLPRFSTPAPVSTPQEPRVRAGWGDLGDSRGGKHDLGRTANTSRSVYVLNPGKDGTPPKKSLIRPNVSSLRSVLSWPSC